MEIPVSCKAFKKFDDPSTSVGNVVYLLDISLAVGRRNNFFFLLNVD